MGLEMASVAAASATVGDNVATGTDLEVKGYDRIINGYFFTGSTAIGDCSVEFYIDDLSIGLIYNTKLLVGNMDDVFQIQPRLVRAGSRIKAVIRDAAAANPIFIAVNSVTE